MIRMITSVRSLLKMLSLEQEEAELYCREKRYERYVRYGGRVRCLRLHALAHNALIPALKISRKVARQKLVVLEDQRKKTDRPCIYCPTHIGGMDVEMAIEAVKTPAWVVIGDPRELYKSLSGMMLQMNGWIPLDVLDKQDRTAAKAQMKALLEKNGDLLIFPEGTQNVSPNLLLNHLYAGAVDLAITCHAEIVPIALEWDKDTYYCVIGENIDYSGCRYEDRFALSENLRDQMATLKWKIIEHLPPIEHSEITDEFYRSFIDHILTISEGYSLTVDFIKETAFRPKGEVLPKEAFAFLDRLQFKKENAFLAKAALRYRKISETAY